MDDVPVTTGCQRNLNDDRLRYKWMTRLHVTESILLLIRFIILCTDLSNSGKQPGSFTFLISILLFELVGGMAILVANLLYLTMIYTDSILYETDSDNIPYCSRKRLLHLSTLTCFKCDCYYDHPHAILLTRVGILSSCFFLRLTASILGAVCANRFHPRAIAYTVFGCISLVSAICTIVLEYRHHRRLWYYYPDGGSTLMRVRQHRGFLPYSIINDQRTTTWRSSLCKRSNCRSRDFFHILMYHSSATQFRVTNDRLNQVVIGFHQTNQKAAFSISRNNFRPTRQIGSLFGAGVYFATCIDHTEFKANLKGAYIIARVNLGRVFLTNVRGAQPPNSQEYDSIYFAHPHGSDEFVVFRQELIEEYDKFINDVVL